MWNFDDGFTSEQQNPVHIFEDTGSYNVLLVAFDSLTCNEAIINDSLYISIIAYEPNLPVNAGVDQLLCLGDSIKLGNPGDTTLNYTWSPVDDLDIPNIAQPVASPDSTTEYVVFVSNKYCEDKDTVLVVVDTELPMAGFEVNYEITCNGLHTYFVNVSQQALSYFWDFGDNSTSIDENPQHIYSLLQGSVISLVAIDENGCTDTVVVDDTGILVTDSILNSLPNVFTPNEDGYNDCFVLNLGERYSNCFEMKIYNRWGIKVFESTDPSDCWKGTIGEKKKAEDGTYYYIVKIKDREFTGHIKLITK